MTGNVDDVINTASNPVIPLMITTGPVACKLKTPFSNSRKPSSTETHIISFVHIQIGLPVSIVIAPHCASHAWPRFLDRQYSLDIVPIDLFARDGVDDGRFDSEKR